MRKAGIGLEPLLTELGEGKRREEPEWKQACALSVPFMTRS